MCGITAYVGNENCFKFVYNGLKQLQNRGYDSSGICSIKVNQDQVKDFINVKYASTNTNNGLEKLSTHENDFDNCIIGIGHTRWATHGAKLISMLILISITLVSLQLFITVSLRTMNVSKSS